MFYNAHNGRVNIGSAEMSYIRFGSGSKNLILIPGIGDGLQTVKGMALPLAFMYRALAKKYTVYAFSRRDNMPKGFTTRDIAHDIASAIDMLKISSAAVFGVSMGGMIAQWLAIDYPKKVEKLVLTVTLARPNDVEKASIEKWLDLAGENNYKGIMLDIAEKSYTEKYYKNMRLMYSIVMTFSKPKSFDTFIIMAHACLSHNTYDELYKIKCPTLIIGGCEDRILTGQASIELHDKIKGSEIKMYEGLSHGAYEEAKDFLDVVQSFLDSGAN